MTAELSANTQAILLLTAPLIVGRSGSASELLKPSEYRALARLLHERGWEPADLLGSRAAEVLAACEPIVGPDRLTPLLARGFQLSQAVDRWQTRAIWVLSRADAAYPARLRKRLGERAPAVLYGCGAFEVLDLPGFGVVGSRRVDEELLRYTEEVGSLAVRAGWSVVSGGARGVDQAAMRGALEADGRVVGILADRLESAALQREHRSYLMEGRLVLVSPYDPSASFNVGNAMARNKLIYAQAEATLVVNADYQKGGTWAGAVEQLRSAAPGPVYVRQDDHPAKGLDGLRERGALPWPEPGTPEAMGELLEAAAQGSTLQAEQSELGLTVVREPEVVYGAAGPAAPVAAQVEPQDAGPVSPEEELLAAIRSLLPPMANGRAEAEIAETLGVPKVQAHAWLKLLVDEGILEKPHGEAEYRLLAGDPDTAAGSPEEELLAVVRSLLDLIPLPATEADLACELQVSSGTARGWLGALVAEGTLVRRRDPVCYGRPASVPLQPSLFAGGAEQ